MFWNKKLPIKYCVDCKYFLKALRTTNSPESYDIHAYSKCMYPEFSFVNNKYIKDKSCDNERTYDLKNSCGPKAKFFEAKP